MAANNNVNELIEFLTKCNDEDEAAARPLEFSDSVVWRVFAITQTDQEVGSHIALHDPARVLRECAARRKLIENYERVLPLDTRVDDNVLSAFEVAITLMAQSYVDRPGFKDEWRVS